MLCLICGKKETVKSHIVPRSLFRLGATPRRQVIGNLRDGPGHQHLQSGFWDRTILCAEHEADLHDPEDYAFRFCKRAASGPGTLEPVTILNARPDHLIAFAAACVWRMAASRSGGRPEKMLGSYAERIRALLFDGRLT